MAHKPGVGYEVRSNNTNKTLYRPAGWLL